MVGEVVRAAGVAWSEELGAAICERTAAGESLRGICGGAGAPALQTVMRWAREKPEFAQALDAARAAAGRPFRAGGVSTFCEETAAVIFDRLAAGEGMVAICRDADMPAASTAWKWMREHEDFREAVGLARQIQADLFFEKGWEIASAVTPKTAFAAKVQLGHLRWHASKLAPKRFGSLKAGEPEADGAGTGGGKVTNIWLKTWVYPTEEGGVSVPSDRPAELVSTIRAGDEPGDEPQVTLGPASWEGQTQVREDWTRANREAVEAARAAGMLRFNGGCPTRFFPQWYREAYPLKWADGVAAERADARYRIGCMAEHGRDAEAEDLIKAGWTAGEAEALHPVRRRGGADERGSGDEWV